MYFYYFKCEIEEVYLQHIFTSFLLQIDAYLLGANHLTSFAEQSLELLAEMAKYFLAT